MLLMEHGLDVRIGMPSGRWVCGPRWAEWPALEPGPAWEAEGVDSRESRGLGTWGGELGQGGGSRQV